MDNGPGQQVIFQSETITPADTSVVPEKRRPGRPKGSGKKYPDGAPPKIKRPVGRPRKDGFPAGSVSAPRSSRKSTSASYPSTTSAVGQSVLFSVLPAYQDLQPHFYPQQEVKPVFQTLQGPDFDGEDWLELSSTKASVFINTLVELFRAPNPVSPAGTVEDAFKTHLNSLSTPVNQSLPSLYSVLRTFWLPTSPTYFCLTGANATRPLLEFRFLYWDPQPLVFNGIACPNCSMPLINRGRITSGPIKIYDLEQPFYIIGCEYVCTSPTCVAATSPEGRKFASTDPAIFRSLPNTLADEFPARLRQHTSDMGSGPDVWNWQAVGVSKALWNLVQGSLRSGVRKEVIRQIVLSVQHGLPEPPPPPLNPQEEHEEPEEMMVPEPQPIASSSAMPPPPEASAILHELINITYPSLRITTRTTLTAGKSTCHPESPKRPLPDPPHKVQDLPRSPSHSSIPHLPPTASCVTPNSHTLPQPPK